MKPESEMSKTQLRTSAAEQMRRSMDIRNSKEKKRKNAFKHWLENRGKAK